VVGFRQGHDPAADRSGRGSRPKQAANGDDNANGLISCVLGQAGLSNEGSDNWRVTIRSNSRH